LLTLAVLSSGLLALATGQAQTGKGKRYALLVGVKEYDHHKLAPLRFTENDVVEMAKLLRPAGYEVTVLCDSTGAKPTTANVKKALKELLAGKRRDDTVLVALAGHGLQLTVKEGGREKDVSFFCPKDAQLNDPDSLVSLEKLFTDLDDCAAGVKLLLVDACRNDPGARGARNLDVDTVPRPPRGIAALFSCASGQRAFEMAELGKGHGVFFHFVLEGLRGKARDDDGEVNWGRLSEYVTRQVNRQVPKLIGGGARQTPHLVTNLVGESPVLLRVKPAEERVTRPTKPRPLDKTRFPDERVELSRASWLTSFPNLGEQFEVLGKSTGRDKTKGAVYNGVSWALGITDHWEWPGKDLADFDRLFASQGYKRAARMNFDLVAGEEKVVLYGKKPETGGEPEITDAARQLEDGSWSAKLGGGPLIRYLSPNVISGPAKGRPVAVYTRPRRTSSKEK
jgi:hypothetical protein